MNKIYDEEEKSYISALELLRQVLNIPTMALFDAFFTCKHSLNTPFWNKSLNKFVLESLTEKSTFAKQKKKINTKKRNQHQQQYQQYQHHQQSLDENVIQEENNNNNDDNDECRIFDISFDETESSFTVEIPLHIQIKHLISRNLFLLVCHLFHVVSGPFSFSVNQFMEPTNEKMLIGIKSEFEYLFKLIYLVANKISLNSCLVLKAISYSQTDFFQLVHSFIQDFDIEKRICLRQTESSRRIQKAFLLNHDKKRK